MAPCPQHPQREAEATCVRCGTFLCDWCLKLAPTWGQGQCSDCQRRKAVPRALAVRFSWSMMLVLALAGLATVGAGHQLLASLASRAWARAATSLGVLVGAAGVGALVLYAARRQVTRASRPAQPRDGRQS